MMKLKTVHFLVFLMLSPMSLFGQNRQVAPAGMVLVEGGAFEMGSSEWNDASPVHNITVNSFFIGIHEITQKEWIALMGSNPSWIKGQNRPVEQVTWYDAIEYCNKRSMAEGLTACYGGSGNNITCDFSANGYRLPTEAEWEYAALGGNTAPRIFRYSGSDDIDKVAWYNKDGSHWSSKKEDETTHDVGSKTPNSLRLYDMSGNVFEWCWDWYDDRFYRNGPAYNPVGPTSGSKKVIRGGSWAYERDFCLIKKRDNRSPNTRTCIGFRVVRTAGILK